MPQSRPAPTSRKLVEAVGEISGCDRIERRKAPKKARFPPALRGPVKRGAFRFPLSETQGSPLRRTTLDAFAPIAAAARAAMSRNRSV